MPPFLVKASTFSIVEFVTFISELLSILFIATAPDRPTFSPAADAMAKLLKKPNMPMSGIRPEDGAS